MIQQITDQIDRGLLYSRVWRELAARLLERHIVVRKQAQAVVATAREIADEAKATRSQRLIDQVDETLARADVLLADAALIQRRTDDALTRSTEAEDRAREWIERLRSFAEAPTLH